DANGNRTTNVPREAEITYVDREGIKKSISIESTTPQEVRAARTAAIDGAARLEVAAQNARKGAESTLNQKFEESAAAREIKALGEELFENGKNGALKPEMTADPKLTDAKIKALTLANTRYQTEQATIREARNFKPPRNADPTKVGEFTQARDAIGKLITEGKEVVVKPDGTTDIITHDLKSPEGREVYNRAYERANEKVAIAREAIEAPKYTPQQAEIQSKITSAREAKIDALQKIDRVQKEANLLDAAIDENPTNIARRVTAIADLQVRVSEASRKVSEAKSSLAVARDELNGLADDGRPEDVNAAFAKINRLEQEIEQREQQAKQAEELSRAAVAKRDYDLANTGKTTPEPMTEDIKKLIEPIQKYLAVQESQLQAQRAVIAESNNSIGQQIAARTQAGTVTGWLAGLAMGTETKPTSFTRDIVGRVSDVYVKAIETPGQVALDAVVKDVGTKLSELLKTAPAAAERPGLFSRLRDVFSPKEPATQRLADAVKAERGAQQALTEAQRAYDVANNTRLEKDAVYVKAKQELENAQAIVRQRETELAQTQTALQEARTRVIDSRYSNELSSLARESDTNRQEISRHEREIKEITDGRTTGDLSRLQSELELFQRGEARTQKQMNDVIDRNESVRRAQEEVTRKMNELAVAKKPIGDNESSLQGKFNDAQKALKTITEGQWRTADTSLKSAQDAATRATDALTQARSQKPPSDFARVRDVLFPKPQNGTELTNALTAQREANEAVAVNQRDIQLKTEEVTRLTAESTTAEETVTNAQAELTRLEAEAKVDQKVLAQKGIASQLERERTSLESQREQKAAEVAKVDAELAKLGGFANAPNNLSPQRALLAQELAGIEGKIAELQGRLNPLERSIREADAPIEAAKQRVVEAEVKRATQDGKLTAAKDDLAALESTRTQLTPALEMANQLVLDAQSSERPGLIESIRNIFRGQQQASEADNQALTQVKDEISRLTREVDNASRMLSEKEAARTTALKDIEPISKELEELFAKREEAKKNVRVSDEGTALAREQGRLAGIEVEIKALKDVGKDIPTELENRLSSTNKQIRAIQQEIDEKIARDSTVASIDKKYTDAEGKLARANEVLEERRAAAERAGQAHAELAADLRLSQERRAQLEAAISSAGTQPSLLTRLWQAVFPPKAAPAPPGEAPVAGTPRRTPAEQAKAVKEIFNRKAIEAKAEVLARAELDKGPSLSAAEKSRRAKDIAQTVADTIISNQKNLDRPLDFILKPKGLAGMG
ncbi:MAG: hypothetical protein HY050_05230, partial [Actinobacteria bacterium]|nr:hypothetical protein [Actinomycetota bacterium]